MKVNYDREADILMIETTQYGTIDHAEHTGPFIAHFSEDGQLILLEILDASDFLASLIKVSISGQELEIPYMVGNPS